VSHLSLHPRRFRAALALLLAVAANLGTAAADGPQPSGPSSTGVAPSWSPPPQFPIVDLPVTFNPPMPTPPDAGDPTQPVWPIEDALTQLPTCSTVNLCAINQGPGGGPGKTTTPPAITVATALSRTTYARGESIPFTLNVTNPGNQKLAVTSVSNPTPAGLAPIPAGTVTMNGQPCNAGTTPTCTVSATNGLQVGSWTMGNSESDTFAFAMVAAGGDRGCGQAQEAAHVTSSGGTNTSSVVTTTCDGGLGTEPWWAYVTRSIGPLGTAAMNVGDGNLVITQDDSTPIPGQGRLVLQPRRVYSSQTSGYGTPPNAFGSGWTIDFESWTGTPSGVAGVGALYVPPAESVTATHPITVVDDGGSRQVVTLQPLATPINVTAISTSNPTAAETVVPRVLSLDTSHYDHICVDEVAARTSGVHLGMWRYTELQAASTSTPCTAAAGTTPVVLGWGAERPDRVRYEFAWDGHKLDAVDGNGNEVRYAYATAPAANASLGMPASVTELASGRAFRISTSGSQTTVVDPAGRSTVYTFDSSSRLTSVANPDGHGLTYSYGCSALATQICSTTDPRGDATSFTYTTTWSDGTAVLGPPKLATIADRQGATTTLAHVHLPDSVTADLGVERTRYSAFDPSGSAGEVDGIDMTNSSSPVTLHQTLLTWDTGSGAPACNQPDAAVDHNLCRSFRETLDGKATAEDTAYTYNPVGQVAVERQCLASSDSTAPSACAPSTVASVTSRDTTHAYTAQYVEAGSSAVVYRDSLSGGGAVSSPTPTNGTRWDASTLYALYDQAASLSPRGNAPGLTSSQVAPFLSTVAVDGGVDRNPNIQATSNPCSGTVFNTGDVCATTSPLNATTGAGSTVAMTYDQYGNLLTLRTADAYAAGSNQQYVFDHFWNTDHDLSGTTSAGGWVRSITDPYGHVTAYGYDAAGNRVRTWDPDATNGIATSSFPGTAASPPSQAYSETRYDSAPTPFSGPWRYGLSQRDAVGDVTSYGLDADGNQTTIRPPRGTAAGNVTTYDVVQTFDKRDMLLTRQTPAEAAKSVGPWRYGYDAFGNRTSTTDPDGVVTVTMYDAVNRPITSKFTRGPWNSTVAPAACSQSSSSDAPIPAGRILCKRTLSYDGVDNAVAAGDANAQVTMVSFDGVHDEVSRTVPRHSGGVVTVRTDHVYDLDGNVTSICQPRAFTDGGASTCSSSAAQPYREDRTYDDQGNLLTDTTYRGSTADATSTDYDADRNATLVQDANGHLQRMTYDFLDHALTTSRQRDGSNWVTTTSSYDPAGRLVSKGTPSSKTAYAYDAAGRRTDQVDGWDGTSSATGAIASSDGGTNIHTHAVYDADGNVVQAYDGRAYSSSSADQRTFMTTTAYDADDRATTQYVPRYDGGAYSDLSQGSAAQSTQCPVNTAGYPASVGVCVSSKSYDGANHVIETVMPTATGSSAARKLDYAITDDGLVASTTEPSAAGSGTATVSTLYDAEGRVVKSTDELGRPDTRAYTSDGLLSQEVAEPNGSTTHVTSYTYNADGKPATVTDPAGLKTTYAYYSDDREQTVADNAGDTTEYVYDGAGNTTQVLPPSAFAKVAPDPSGAAISNTYTYDNLLLSSTRPVSGDGTSQLRRTTYGYTDFGAKASQDTALVNSGGGVLSDAGTQSFAYYPDARVQKETGRQGETITHSYDAAGNQVGVVAGSSTVSASYYLDGLPRSVTDTAIASGAAAATTSYGYDGAGNVASRVEALATGASYRTTFGYDDAGLPTAMNVSWLGAGWSWSYDAAQEVTQENDPNGDGVSYVWNADATINTRNLYVGSPTGVLAQWGYLYDSDYRQTERDFHGATAINTAATLYNRYAYDNAGRLQTFSHSDVTGNPGPTVTATWDVDGNRTKWSDGTTAGTTTTSYNADDSIATQQSGSSPTLTYTYAAFGGVSNDGCTADTYDGFDRLTSSRPTNPSTACPPWWQMGTYSYDGLDRQVAVSDGPYGATTDVHFDGLSTSVALEQQETGHPADVVYGLSATGDVLADDFAPGTINRTEFLSQDGYSSITDVTAGNGAMACDSFTDPFGAPMFSSGLNPCHTGSLNDTVLYRSSKHDPATGAYVLGRRTYDPTKASFLQPDSFRLDGQDPSLLTNPSMRNAYGYAGGDPVNNADPTGHDICRENPQDCVDDNGAFDQGMADAQTAGTRGGSAQQVTQAQAVGQQHGSAASRLRRAVHAAALHTKALSELNAPDSNGSYDSCSPMFVFDRSVGAAQYAPHVYDGCNRNPVAGGVCHNRGGLDTIDCGFRDAIAGPPAPSGTYYDNEFLVHGHCNTDCLINTLAIVGVPFDGEEEADAALVTLIAHVATDDISSSFGFISRLMLNRQLASGSQMAAAGRAIAGAGTSVPLRVAQDLARQYGGDPAGWAKMTSKLFRGADGFGFQLHWYEYLETGLQVEWKTKFKGLGAP
jgi:RHS repeat-associated protein/uncharacterized repeat protein (TIGR01451 family)